MDLIDRNIKPNIQYYGHFEFVQINRCYTSYLHFGRRLTFQKMFSYNNSENNFLKGLNYFFHNK